MRARTVAEWIGVVIGVIATVVVALFVLADVWAIALYGFENSLDGIPGWAFAVAAAGTVVVVGLAIVGGARIVRGPR